MSASVAVSVPTAVSPSWTVNAAALVISGAGPGAGPGTVTPAATASFRPSRAHAPVSQLQGRFAGNVITTSPSPSGVTGIRHPMLLRSTRRLARCTVPPVVVSNPEVNAEYQSATSSLNRRSTANGVEPSWRAGAFSNAAVSRGSFCTVTVTVSS